MSRDFHVCCISYRRSVARSAVAGIINCSRSVDSRSKVSSKPVYSFGFVLLVSWFLKSNDQLRTLVTTKVKCSWINRPQNVNQSPIGFLISLRDTSSDYRNRRCSASRFTKPTITFYSNLNQVLCNSHFYHSDAPHEVIIPKLAHAHSCTFTFLTNSIYLLYANILFSK